MKTAYFDASAIVKLLVHEPESLALLDYLEHSVEATTSKVSLIDVIRVIGRHGPQPADDPEGVFEAFALLDVTRQICREAGALNPPRLRSIDALHLATALSIHDPRLDFITYDDRLARAAEANGLRVLQPGRDN